jgi:xanthine/uracil permease
MLVIMTEASTDMLVIGRVVDKPVTPADVSDGLRADTLGSVVSSLLNGFQASAYGQNIGLLVVSRVKTRFAVAMCGLILVVLALFPLTAAVIAAVPLPVLGGAGIAVFGLVAVNGVQVLTDVDFTSERGSVNGLIVAGTLTMGLIPTAAPGFYAHFPQGMQTIFSSGIAAGAITAVILNLVVHAFGRESGVVAPAAEPTQTTPGASPTANRHEESDALDLGGVPTPHET